MSNFLRCEDSLINKCNIASAYVSSLTTLSIILVSGTHLTYKFLDEEALGDCFNFEFDTLSNDYKFFKISNTVIINLKCIDYIDFIQRGNSKDNKVWVAQIHWRCGRANTETITLDGATDEDISILQGHLLESY